MIPVCLCRSIFKWTVRIYWGLLQYGNEKSNCQYLFKNAEPVSTEKYLGTDDARRV